MEGIHEEMKTLVRCGAMGHLPLDEAEDYIEQQGKNAYDIHSWTFIVFQYGQVFRTIASKSITLKSTGSAINATSCEQKYEDKKKDQKLRFLKSRSSLNNLKN